MIIEIRKAGFVNKGAELMLFAVKQQIQNRYPSAKIVVAPSSLNGSRPFSKIVNHGLWLKAFYWRYGVQWGDLARFIPFKIREMYGLILDREVDVVLDAAGFSYGDKFGVSSSLDLSRSSKRWKRNGTKLILLPQAFGPYKSHSIRSLALEWINNSDLIFARDNISYKYLTDLCLKNHIKIAHDFTNLIEGIKPEDCYDYGTRVAIVPNSQMIRKINFANLMPINHS